MIADSHVNYPLLLNSKLRNYRLLFTSRQLSALMAITNYLPQVFFIVINYERFSLVDSINFNSASHELCVHSIYEINKVNSA